MTAFLNLIHGDDATAELDNMRRPFRTMAALKAAADVWCAAQCAADPNPETCEHQRAYIIIDQGDCVPAKFRL